MTSAHQTWLARSITRSRNKYGYTLCARFRRAGRTAPAKRVFHVVERHALPLGDHVRVNLITARQFGNRLVAPDRRQGTFALNSTDYCFLFAMSIASRG